MACLCVCISAYPGLELPPIMIQLRSSTGTLEHVFSVEWGAGLYGQPAWTDKSKQSNSIHWLQSYIKRMLQYPGILSLRYSLPIILDLMFQREQE